jgi:hypothetical protein
MSTQLSAWARLRGRVGYASLYVLAFQYVIDRVERRPTQKTSELAIEQEGVDAVTHHGRIGLALN